MTGRASCGDQREAEQCLEHEGLAVAFARRAGMLDDDGLQAARIGVLQAVRRFDPERGARFSTYAAFWIRAELELERAARQIVGITPAAMQRRRRILAVRPELACASVEQLAAAARVSPEQVIAMEALGGLEARDLWGRGQGGLYLEERLAHPGVAIDELLDAFGDREALSRALDKLAATNPRLAEIVERRTAGEALHVIGESLGVSRERVRQLEARAHAWLRAELERVG